MRGLRRIIQSVLVLVVSGLVVYLAVGLWRAKSQQEERVAPETGVSGSEMKLTDMEYTEMQGGRRLWTIKASEASYFQAEQKTALQSVLLTFFLKEGGEIRLESHHGALYAGTKNIELWDSVQAVLPQGFELTTDRVFYDHEAETVSSEAPIRVEGPDLKLRAGCWKYRIPEHLAVLEGGIDATLVFLPPRTESRK